MVAQSALLSTFHSSPTPHLHIAGETCPTCGQDIPPDKLEEISGRIAAREREQTLAITARLEQKHETEKAAAAAKATADLEALRRQSAEREADAREEARQAAEAAAAERQAQLEQSQKEAMGAVQKQLADEAAARVAAEQAGASLQTQFQRLTQDHKEELTTLKAEAVAKESEIREEARRAAQEAAAQQVATAETARQQATEALQTTTAELEAARTAAAEQASVSQEQLAELQQTKDSEIAQVKEGAAAETLRAREEAAAAIAAAQARSTEAEEKLATLTEQQQATLKQELDVQREVLETAKVAEINQIKAKAFEDNQRQVDKLTAELRALEKKTNDELGEGAEIDLFEDLKANFPDDKIEKIAKVVGGADIRHIVMLNNKPSGTILYDSKNRGKFLFEHVTKLRTDQIADKADHAILSTHKFPKDTRQLHIHEGVVLANPARVVAVATLIRQHLIMTLKLRISRAERESKTAELYEFITSERCAQYLESVDRHADELLKLQVKEKQAHDAMWKKEGELLKKIQKAQADISNEISCIVGTADVDEPALEESEL